MTPTRICFLPRANSLCVIVSPQRSFKISFPLDGRTLLLNQPFRQVKRMSAAKCANARKKSPPAGCSQMGGSNRTESAMFHLHQTGEHFAFGCDFSLLGNPVICDFRFDR